MNIDASMSNIESFFTAYRGTLDANMAKHPDQYFAPRGTDLTDPEQRARCVTVTVEKMREAILKNNYTMSPAIQAACRACKIKPTMKALAAYLRGEAV